MALGNAAGGAGTRSGRENSPAGPPPVEDQIGDPDARGEVGTRGSIPDAQ